METTEEHMARLEEKIDAIYKSVEKTRKYFLTTLIITLVTLLLPIIIAAFLIPMAMSTFGSMYLF
jgi:hypothetical protein